MIFIPGRVLTPLPCENCQGEKEVRGVPLCPEGCTCGGRLHGFDDAVCPECKGTGYRACVICGEHPAVGPDEDGDEACVFCLKAEADEHRGLSLAGAAASLPDQPPLRGGMHNAA